MRRITPGFPLRAAHHDGWRLSTHFGRRLQLGFGVPILLLLVLSAVSYRSIVVSRAGTALVRHTQQVIERLSELQSAMQDIEVGYRGFVLVGDHP
jgi:CHASE3 domain sensor protein